MLQRAFFGAFVVFTTFFLKNYVRYNYKDATNAIAIHSKKNIHHITVYAISQYGRKVLRKHSMHLTLMVMSCA